MADQIATPDAISAPMEAPRKPNRQAVTMIRGSITYCSPNRFWKRTNVTRPVATSRPASSSPRRREIAQYFPPPLAGEGRVGAFTITLNSNGATSRTPIASPVHQTVQVDQKLVEGTDAESSSTELPMVALIVIAPSAAAIM